MTQSAVGTTRSFVPRTKNGIWQSIELTRRESASTDPFKALFPSRDLIEHSSTGVRRIETGIIRAKSVIHANRVVPFKATSFTATPVLVSDAVLINSI